MAMDVKRDPAILKRKKMRQAVILGVVAVAVAAISVAVGRLQPAAPSVPEGTLWFGTVKRGPMVREVRGAGTLVPEDIRWIAATVTGRVERIVLRPGATVKPGTVILILSNPDLRQQVNDAELAWKGAKAQLETAAANLKTQRLSQELDVANAQSALNLAQSDLEANKSLNAQGVRLDFVRVEDLRHAIEVDERLTRGTHCCSLFYRRGPLHPTWRASRVRPNAPRRSRAAPLPGSPGTSVQSHSIE